MRLTTAQRQAVQHRGSNLLVTASAGSGKTEVLARRCVELVADPQRPCGIDRLLVVTFTRAAAAELRVRVSGMLRAAADRARQRQQRHHLRRQALLVDAADIGTIDSWCGRIVRAHFAAAGVDPAFTVLGEQESWLLRREVLDELFEWVYTAADAPAAAARRWIRRHARPSDDFLRTLILELNAFREHLVDPDQWFERQLRAHRRDEPELRAAAERMLADALGAECRFQHEQMEHVLCDAAEPLATEFRRYRDVLAAWGAQLGPAGRVLDVLDQIGSFALRKPRGLAGDEEALFEEVRARWFKKRLKERWPAAELRATVENASAAARLVVTLLQLEARFRARLDAVKRQQAAYEYADVLRLALDLLGTPTATGPRAATGVGRALQRRYEHILVDEYQDTSPVQAEILRLVTRPERGASNRFMVGDIKQSIYGFRQAEPRLFAELIRAFDQGRAEGRALPLSDNFRSHADLLAGLNHLFAKLFEPALGGTTYGERERLRARRDEVANPAWDGRPRIELHLLEAPQPPPAQDHDAEIPLERVEREALLAAHAIRALLEAGAQVPQRGAHGGPTLRPLRLTDVVILLRSARQNAAIVARTLRTAGVPAVAAGRESILDSTEVTDVRNALALLVNRRQDVALAAYLRGPLVGLAPAELLAIRRASPKGAFCDAVARYRHAAEDANLAAKLTAAMEQLDRWLVLGRERELPALLRDIMRRTGLLFFAAALPGGAHRVATLRALEHLAASFSASGRAGLAEFVEHLEALADQELSPAAPAAEAADAVRVLTIHAAKGLEFPVVFLLNAGAEFNRQRRGGRSLCDQDRGVGLKFSDRLARAELSSAARVVIAHQTAERELAEELRLLYVAATRARERLYIVGHAEPGAWEIWRARYQGRPPPLIARLTARSMLEWVLLATAASGVAEPDGASRRLVAVTTHAPDALAPAPPAPPARRGAAAARDAADERWIEDSRSLLEAEPDTTSATLPAVVSVSALKERVGRGQDEDVPPAVDAGTSPLRSPRLADTTAAEDGRSVGVACHRFLQHADLGRLGSPAAARAQLRQMVAAGRLSPREAQQVPLDDLVWFGTTREAALLAEHAERCRREVPFVHAWRVPGANDRLIVRGVIDCLVELPDGLTILDYKTDRMSAVARPQERLARYGVQLQLYAAAAAAVFGRPVLRAALVFLRDRRVVDVPLELPPLRSVIGE